MADILQITLPDGTTYNIKDNNALPLIGGQVTGPVTFGDSVSIDDLTAGNIIVTGAFNAVQGIPYSMITGTPTIPSAATATPVMDGIAAVGSSTKYARENHVHPSDTTKADVSTTVTNVSWDSTNSKIQKTINGTTSDVVVMPIIAGTGTRAAIGGVTSGTDACVASGADSFAFGYKNTASGGGSVAFGTQCICSGSDCFSIGYQNTVSANYSNALGFYNVITQPGSLAIGAGLKVSSYYQNVIGAYNIEDTENTYIFILGNGESNNARSNALTVDWYGNVTATSFIGSLTGNATNVTGTVAIANGGTGATTASGALTNLGISNVVLSDTSRKIYLTTTEAVPSGAVTGDIVFVKIT